MAEVMAVAFEEYGTLHYLDVTSGDFHVGDAVLFPTADGPEVARCVWGPVESEQDWVDDLPKCGGIASEDDLARDQQIRQRRHEVAEIAKETIARHGLPMRVIATDVVMGTQDKLAVIYFTAPGRVDFRRLVGDLARAVGSRIDLRQVASRDAARLVGGLGSCGRQLCCTSFVVDLEPLSMRIAKEQGLPNNPMQLSGPCGRLKCCLRFEHSTYVDFYARAPEIGERVVVSDETGEVVGYNVLADSVVVCTDEGMTQCPLSEVCRTKE